MFSFFVVEVSELPNDMIKKLKKGYWVIQGSIDLHGMVSKEAKDYIVDYIQECKKKKMRCVRIIHGKGYGSKNKEPILKKKGIRITGSTQHSFGKTGTNLCSFRKFDEEA